MFSETISVTATTINHLKSQIQFPPNYTVGHKVDKLEELEKKLQNKSLTNQIC